MKLIQRGLVVGMRRALFGGCLLAASAGTAWAQQAGAAPAGPTPPADTEATTLDRILVTAQSREQELQDVPIALQVLNDQIIQDVAAEDLGDLDSFVPGLQINSVQPTQPSIALRGISTDDFGIGTDPAVGVFIDGVYTGRSGGILLPLTDVERIEVLKGPQGTLFGRNTAAGAVSVITKKPSNEMEAAAKLRLGNYGKQYLEAMTNIPLNDRAALRLNGLLNHSDGWVEDGETGQDLGGDNVWATRAALQLGITDNTTALLSWDHESLDQRGRPTTGIVPLPPAPGLPVAPADPLTYLDPRDIDTFNDTNASAEWRTFDGVTLIVDHGFEWGHLTSTTAWRQFDALNRVEEDGTNRPNLYLDSTNSESNETRYQEFKFSGATDRLDWVAGASYYEEEASQTSEINTTTTAVDTAVSNLGLAPTPDGTLFGYFSQVLGSFGIPLTLMDHAWNEQFYNTLKTKSYAGFGDVIWHVNDKLNLTFGLRYTRDEKDFSWFNDIRNAPTLDATLDALEAMGVFALAGVPRESFVFDLAFIDPPAMINKGLTNRANRSWSDWSPRLVADYHFSDNLMGFASLAKGYKAGGYNALQIGSEFDNENVWNAEVGIKHSLPEARLAYNASVFSYRYDNRQSIRLDNTTTIPRFVVDTGDVEAYGVDFDLRWQISNAFGIDFNAEYINSKYKNYSVNTNAGLLDLNGQATGEPSWSAALGGHYTWSLGDAGDLRLALRHAYRGACRSNDFNRDSGDCTSLPNFSTGESQNRTDLRLGWSAANGHWTWAVYGNNVFDNQYVGQLNVYGREAFGTVGAVVSEPRTYGMEVGVKF
ncbi:TonB-dependent receptor [Pseudoxanthomonas yeongjuensis]|uniref:TonB-dependent receptor n=1 Tax=Pseudoxanthomonas yeongjuensis TaxID=377616 RepID=UPI001390D92C|nr:TonB-dependent receptor [Pseudoxanthomonas yeongjuensis]